MDSAGGALELSGESKGLGAEDHFLRGLYFVCLSRMVAALTNVVEEKLRDRLQFQLSQGPASWKSGRSLLFLVLSWIVLSSLTQHLEMSSLLLQHHP